jgi:hypothetical protein
MQLTAASVASRSRPEPAMVPPPLESTPLSTDALRPIASATDLIYVT